MRREGGVLAQAFADVEAGADYDIMTPNDSIVRCDARCVFNGDGVCSAEHIVVDDALLLTKCRTRRRE
jgi:hypothetical protein